MKKHINIPIFIPHYGCPNDCVFCNQKKITGKRNFDKDEVMKEIENALSTAEASKDETELAFFGGSFTALPRNEMLELLEISDYWLKLGKISSVRLSTRPDAINEEILEILSKHGVKTIELGIQSFSDEVLSASNRGHSAESSVNACKLVKKYGFNLIGQMMVGLPCSTLGNEIETAEKICELGCDGARVYPTVVFPDTELERMKELGVYTPLTNEEAIYKTSEVLSVFASHGIPVIRIGLCSNETLHDERYANNYHPSVGELALNLLFRKYMRNLIKENKISSDDTVIFTVAKGKTSQAVGQKRSNIKALSEEFGIKNIKVTESDSLSGYEITLNLN